MSDKITRRLFITALAAIAVPVPAMAEMQTMTVNQAYKAASKGEILFLDIRTPQEWQQTGIPEPAQPVSMHLKSFLTKLIKLTGGDKTKPVAVICATGSRSSYLQKALTNMGYSNIINVAEGVIGGPKGKGWIASGLPVKKVKP